ncbi:MAG: TPM domain-containing protein [Candidatus Altiarchaeota archaeon]
MKNTCVFLCVVLAASLVSALEYPQLTGFVTDTADMIDPSWEASINSLARQIEENTTAEIAVVTVPSLEGLTKEQYAVELFGKAGIGKKDKANGLLILVARDEREYRFEVGYGLEAYVTDSMYVTIGKRIIEPNFKEGEYGRGLYEAVEVIGGLIAGQEDVVSEYSMPAGGDAEPDIWSNIFSLLFFIFLIYLFSKGGFFPLFFFGGPRIRTGGGWNSSGGFGGGGFGGFGGGFSGGGGFGGRW